jgi:N-acetylglucosaminyl-diphospho-decaprenol L-rhamnosyltransferase
MIGEPALLDVIIVNWNAGRLLADCLERLAGVAREDDVRLGSVIVVDNASTDGSADRLEFPGLPLRVVKNRENKGFATACNQGAASCSSPFLLLLNPDTRLRTGALRVPLEVIESGPNERVAIVGIQNVDARGEIARSCARFPTPKNMIAQALGLDRLLPGTFQAYSMSEWEHAETRYVDHVIGAFYMVRRSVWDALGGMDERFFLYLEDLDFSRRAALAGWKTCFVAGASLFHEGGGTSKQVKEQRLFHSLRSRLAYAGKHFRPVAGGAVLAVTMGVEPIIRVAYALVTPGHRVRDVTRAYGKLWTALPEIVTSMSRQIPQDEAP